jgi:hypothetical protein
LGFRPPAHLQAPPPLRPRAAAQRAALAAWRIPGWADTTSWPGSREARCSLTPPLRVGVLLGRLAPGGVLGGRRVGEPGVRPQGGGDARRDLVQLPVKPPAVAKVIVAVEPLARPQRERFERGRQNAARTTIRSR